MSPSQATLERERELERISAALDSAVAGSGRVVVIEGRAGIGKTRLIQATRELAKARGFGRLQAIGDSLESAMAWGVVRQMVERSVTRYTGEVREAILAGPSGAALRALADAAHDPSEAELARTLHELWWVAVDLSSTRPLLITVDDAHWADLSSLQYLAYLSRRIADLPIALVVATRPPADNAGPLAQLSVVRQAERVLPRPLTEDATAGLVAERAGGLAPAPAVTKAVYAAGGGNPFLLGVLLDEIEALGLPLDDAATAERIGSLGPSTVYRASLGRLSPAAVAVSGAVAVLGSGSDPWLAGSLVDLDPARLPAAVEELIAGNVLTESGEGLAYVHPVVREAVLTDLGAVARGGLHARAATALRGANASADRIAAHLVQAPRGTLPDAVDVLRTAATALLAAGDSGTAADHLTRALEESPGDVTVEGELGRALFRAGRLADARSHLRAAAAGRGEQQAELLASSASATALIDGPQAAIAELGEVLRGWPDGPSRLHLEARLAVVRSFLAGERQAAAAHLRRFADLPGHTPDERTLLGLLAQTGRYEVWPAEEVAALATRALGEGAYFADAQGSADALVAWVVAVLALMATDGVEVARREIDRAQARVRVHGSPVEYAMVANTALFHAWRTGDMAFVEAEAEGALAAVADEDPLQQVVALRATASHFAAYAALERGDSDAAAAILDRFDARHGDEPLVIPRMWLHEPRALIALARGVPVLARKEAYLMRDEMNAAGVDPPTIPWRSPAVHAALLLGDEEEARTLAAEQLDLARRWGAATELGSALRLVARTDPERRLELLEESLAVLERSPARLQRARTLVDLGEALRVARRRTDAREPLHRAIELATECGATALRARAVDALEALGDRPRRTVMLGPQALTASERRVADLAVTGRPNREIARELFVTPKTVENHLGRIYTKLGINGRRELATALT